MGIGAEKRQCLSPAFFFVPDKAAKSAANAVIPTLSNTSVIRTSTSLAQTAHTPKQGPSRPRPQHGFVLSAKFLLFRHAFIYIHFPVLCEPSLSATALSQTTSRHVFQLLAQTAHVCFHERKCVYTRLSEKNRTQGHTRRNRGRFRWGAITTLGPFHTFRKPCVARYQNGVLCRFWVLTGCTSEGHREPSGQRCAYARRCPEASRPRWAM